MSLARTKIISDHDHATRLAQTYMSDIVSRDLETFARTSRQPY